MTLFGPAGNSEAFYEQGYKSTSQAPAWLAKQGLNAYEYSAGSGVMLKEATARSIGEEAQMHGISLSIHAPYFINFCNVDEEKRFSGIKYIQQAARAIDWMGGKRVIFHVGATTNLDRGIAMENALGALGKVMELLEDDGLGHIILCPETMGKKNQFGHLDEILHICRIFPTMYPTIDFAHLHALDGGVLNTPEDFEGIVQAVESALGHERARKSHIHFSTIEYTAAGEKRHRTFAEEDYGPRFENLAPILHKYNWEPVIICESKGTMAMDAAEMMRIYNSFAPDKSED